MVDDKAIKLRGVRIEERKQKSFPSLDANDCGAQHAKELQAGSGLTAME